MTDNRTTELLPCPWCGGESTVERIGKSGYYYVACNTAYCCDFGKFDTEAEAIAAWNTRAATTIGKVQVEIEPVSRGTLTAEQVREAIKANSWAETSSLFEFNDSSYQAIAAELTAELESGTCEVESKIFIEGEYVPCPYYEYEMECGGQFRWDDAEPPNYCPNCGRKVVSA